MIKYTFICDRCGKETDTPIRIFGCRVDTKTDKVAADVDPPKNELCPDCLKSLVDWIKAGPQETNYEAIVRLYREGKEIPEIEELTGVPCAAISRVVIKEGLGAERYPVTNQVSCSDGKGRGFHLSAEKRNKIIEMVKDEYPPEQIAADLKIKLKTVSAVIAAWQEAGNED